MGQIILISGKQGSGKSSTQNLVKAILESNYVKRVALINFADVIYNIHDLALGVLLSHGIDAPKKDGKLLQLLGTDWGRNVYGDNVWVDIMRDKIEQAFARGIDVVIIGDCRFTNEFEAFPEALRVRLHAPEAVRKERCNAWRENTKHPSETDLDNMESLFDLRIDTAKETVGIVSHTIAKKLISKMYSEVMLGKN